MAEGILQQKAFDAGLIWSVESAGTNGYHDGEPPHPLSQKVARLNGIDISHQRSRRIRSEDFERFDLIYAMAGDVVNEMRRITRRSFDPDKVQLLMDTLYPGQERDIPDPWAGPESDYHEVFTMIDKACDAIIKKFAAEAARS